MTKVFEDVDLRPLERAVATLEDALKRPPNNDLERDGVIQRFEYSFELSWKTVRRCLVAMGRPDVSASPKPIIREAAKEGFIANPAEWIEFMEFRNAASHVYNEAQAQAVYEAAKAFPECARSLLSALCKYGSK